MITVRFNFETNSSSQHSLSCRKDVGAYTEAELQRTEECIGKDIQQDAIIVMKENDYCHNNLLEGTYCRNNDVYLSSSDLDFKYSAMQVLSTFKRKLDYTIATIVGKKTRGWEKRKQEACDIVAKLLPNITFDYERIFSRSWHPGSVRKNILFPFLRENKISLEEFLTNKKYIVIIDYAEYCKMRYLNMVDENSIDFEYHPITVEKNTINIVDGVWKIEEDDLSFGRSPFRVLGTVEGKARYALAAHHNVEQVISILNEVYPDLEKIEVIPTYPEYASDEDSYGYCEDSAIPNDVSLREFILNKKYVIISDGDEYCIWKDFTNSSLFKRDAYEEISDNKDWEED